MSNNPNNAQTLAAVIQSILESPAEQWLAQPKVKASPVQAKIPRKEFTPCQQSIWMPSWANTANPSQVHEQSHQFTPVANSNGMAGRRTRTETANSNTSLGSSLSFFVDTSPPHQHYQLPANQTGNYKYSFDFSPVEQTVVDEEAEDDFECDDPLGHKLPSVLNQVKSLLSGLGQVEQQLSKMVITNKQGQANATSPSELNEMKRKMKMIFDEKPETKFAKLTLQSKDNKAEEKQFKSPNYCTTFVEKYAPVNSSPPLKLSSDPAHWLKKYPPPKQNRPMNEMAEDLSCWESVLGWKGILEKIHASGEDVWLAPSSRAIKS